MSADREMPAADRRRLRAAGLRHVSDQSPGIRRERSGDDFIYRSASGQPVKNARTLRRIRALAIPPAYTEVWICADTHGHLQATGYDNRGRKQYRYHPQWRVLRDRAKFERLSEFGAALPRLRARLRRDLGRPGLTHDKVLALVVALLDSTRTRVGNDRYRRDNGSYGLTTLRTRHAELEGAERLRLRFRGKSGRAHEIEIDDARLARIVRRCQQLPGQRLFQYLDAGQIARPVDSDDVNDYLAEAMGAPFTAKDFRTWHASLRAIALLGARPPPDSERSAKAVIVEVVRAVADELRNTPAVCRKSYIHPRVFEAWRDGRLQPPRGGAAAGASAAAETWAVRFLRRARSASSAPRAGAESAVRARSPARRGRRR